MVWPWLPRLSTYIHFTYLGIIHASEPAHTCTRARGASSVVEVVEEGRRHISSLIVLLKFLSLPSRHYPQPYPLPTPTPTQLQPTTKNQELYLHHHHHHGWLRLHLKLWMRFERKLHLRKFFFFPYHQRYLPRYSRFMMMMMMLITLPLYRRSRRLDRFYHTNYQRLILGDGDDAVMERGEERKWRGG